jgi:hypothetical protein
MGSSIFYEADSIDNVMDESGNLRRRILFNVGYPFFEESWIEGVGSTWGLTTVGNWQVWADANYELLCLKENGSTTFYNPLYDTCYMSTVGTFEHRAEQPKLQILSGNDGEFIEFQLKGLDDRNINFEVYDIMGRRLIVGAMAGSSYKLSGHRLPSGMYICRITDSNKINLTGKFMVMY